MVRVKLFFKNGQTKISTFPEASLKDVRISGKRINPKIVKVELYRKKVRRVRRNPFGFGF